MFFRQDVVIQTHYILRIFATLVVLSITACQPLSTKKSSVPAPQTKSQISEPVPSATDVNSNSDETSTPTQPDTVLPRRKIPTLREQMEKLQGQQDVTNLKIDSLRSEVQAMKRQAQDRTRGSEHDAQSEQNKEPIRGETFKAETTGNLPLDNKKGVKKKRQTESSIIEPDNTANNLSKTVEEDIKPDSPTAEKKAKKKIKSRDIVSDEMPPAKRREKQSADTKLVEPAKSSAAVPKIEKKSSDPKFSSEASSPAAPVAPSKADSGKKTSESSALLFNTAMTLFTKRQYQEAIDLLGELKNKGDDAEQIAKSSYWIGESYYGLAKYDEAITNFETVLASKSPTKSSKALAMIAECYLKKGNVEEAKKNYRKLQKSYPLSDEAVLASKRLQQF